MASEKLNKGLQSGARFAARFVRATLQQGSSPNSSTTSPTAPMNNDELSGRYLFGGDGSWIAYRSDRGIFDAETNDLIGYLPYDDGHVADESGDYLCSIVEVHLWRAYGAPWANAGVSPVRGPGIPPPPISTLLDPMQAPAGYGPFSR